MRTPTKVEFTGLDCKSGCDQLRFLLVRVMLGSAHRSNKRNRSISSAFFALPSSGAGSRRGRKCTISPAAHTPSTRSTACAAPRAKHVKRNPEAADGRHVDPAAIPPHPLGQLLVQRGILTATQFERVLAEQRRNGKSLDEIIIERGLAEPHTVEAVLADESGTEQNNVIAFADAARGGRGRAEEDAEWRRKLFDLADPNDTPAASPNPPPKQRGGIQGRLVRNLEAYLARTAGELDERGEILQRRSIALAQELERVAAAEAAVEQRAVRLRELDLAGAETASRIDELLGLIGERDARVEAIEGERDDLVQRLDLTQADLARAQAELVERKELLSSRDERISELTAEVEALRTSWQLTERNLAERNETLVRLETANEAQTRDLAEARQALAVALAESAERAELLGSSEQKQAALVEELEHGRARFHSAEGHLAERDQMLAKLEAANEAQNIDLEAVRGALDESRARLSGLERQFEETEAALTATRRKLQHVQSENAELASLHEEQQAELAKRSAAAADLQARLDEKLRRKREYEDQIEGLNSRLADRERRLSKLLERLGNHEKELQEVRRREEERDAALTRAIAELAERQSLLIASDRRAAALTEQLEAVRATLRATDRGVGHGETPAPEGNEPSPRAAVSEETTHLCFAPHAGTYTLVERSGPLPKPGDEISSPDYGGHRFVVSHLGRSPLPLDERMCAYLQALD